MLKTGFNVNFVLCGITVYVHVGITFDMAAKKDFSFVCMYC